tara:strand:- start:246 stop:821 length:576 start_codon:yes stop_codon:yes gene_type:complete
MLPKNELNTGDYLLFRGDGNDKWYDTLIEDVTDSPYIHAAMVLRDPNFYDFSANGLYAIETDGDTGETHIVTLDEILYGRTWVDVRRWQNVSYNNLFLGKLHEFYDLVDKKPYDRWPCDWLKVGLWNLGFKCFGKVKRHENNFWCSALVAFGATKLGLLPKITDWSNMSPADLARQRIEHPFVLGDIERLK